MVALALRTFELLFYHLLLSVVDRVSRLPRDSTVPEAMRLYRENIALKALLVIDIHTRELLDLRVHDGWDVDSAWTAEAFGAILRRTGRKPAGVVHDHGTHFRGQFERQLRVIDIDDQLTPVRIPQLNCYAERAIGSIRRELLRHVRVPHAEELQFLLDEYRRYANTERAHQGLAGRTPAEVSTGIPQAAVIDLATVRSHRLVRREYAHGLLSGYTLVPGDDDYRQAA